MIEAIITVTACMALSYALCRLASNNDKNADQDDRHHQSQKNDKVFESVVHQLVAGRTVTQLVETALPGG